jgi:hypothetical protein
MYFKITYDIKADKYEYFCPFCDYKDHDHEGNPFGEYAYYEWFYCDNCSGRGVLKCLSNDVYKPEFLNKYQVPNEGNGDSLQKTYMIPMFKILSTTHEDCVYTGTYRYPEGHDTFEGGCSCIKHDGECECESKHINQFYKNYAVNSYNLIDCEIELDGESELYLKMDNSNAGVESFAYTYITP